MIFYFTGTGNSQYAAQKLCADGEQLIRITNALWAKEYRYTPDADESVGFVFPCYFSGLPSTVYSFVKRIKFTCQPKYVYAVVTCGMKIAASGKMLGDLLAGNGTVLNGVYSLKMPANYAVMYDINQDEIAEQRILGAADVELEEIRAGIAERRTCGLKPSPVDRAMTNIMYPMYRVNRKTAKFYVNDTCVGCSACANRCPAHAIEMVDGHPTWVKDKCDHCMSCVRCGAIEYGNRLTGKYRYKHPMLRKKTAHGADAHGEHGAAGSHDHGAGDSCCGSEGHEH